jgi:Fuc2NAc and GlcNAc transferase
VLSSAQWPAAAILATSLAVATVATWWGTSLVRRYAITRSLVDVPNVRSSHNVPTPRGGGLAIAVVVSAGVAFQTIIGGLRHEVGIGLLGGGGLIALVGWIDDHSDLRPRWRATAQFVAAIWFVFWVGAPPSLWFGPWSLPLSAAAPAVAVFGLVWLTNLFNFMDGIDGIAGGESLSVGAVGGLLLLAAGASDLAGTAFLVAAASLGFLFWNWAPARIFMGDVGSGFVGFILGALATASDQAGAVPLMVWLLLMAVFVFDATVTLLRRLGREPFYEAHRRHAYQRAVAAGASHGTVAGCVLTLNALLAVAAAIAWVWPETVPLAILSVFALLLFVYVLVERRQPMWAEGADTGYRCRR